MLVAVLLGHQDLDRLPEQLLWRIAEQRLGTAIEEHDIAVVVGNNGRIGRGMQQFVNDLGGQFAGGHRGRHGSW